MVSQGDVPPVPAKWAQDCGFEDAVHQAVRDVYGAQLPHYFKYVSGSDETTTAHPPVSAIAVINARSDISQFAVIFP